MPEQCIFRTFAGRNGPSPEPPEYCEEDAEPDSDYCLGHRDTDDV